MVAGHPDVTPRASRSLFNVEALGGAGYTTAQALEVIAQAACTSMANWAANLADPPVDKSFQPQRWEAVAEAAVR
jgi:hypothetical protein